MFKGFIRGLVREELKKPQYRYELSPTENVLVPGQKDHWSYL